MDLAALNRATRPEAVRHLLACCAATTWAEAMTDRRPFAGVADLLDAAGDEWWMLGEDDWLEAFAAHPRIGDRAVGDDQHGAWSRAEQSGVDGADDATAAALAGCNRDYEARFGHVFLICATGLAAVEILAACRLRLQGEPDTELLNAAAEQEKITEIRLKKLLEID